MTYQSSPDDIMDAEFVANDAATLGAMVPYQQPTTALEITPQKVYELLPPQHRDTETWSKLKRAPQADLERAYQHLVVNVTHNNYVEHHHHYEAPPTPPEPPSVQFVPMPYPVYEPSPQPQYEQQPVVINNYVETSSHGGNAFAHAQSESDDWTGGRHVFAAIFCGLAIVALVGAIGGE